MSNYRLQWIAEKGKLIKKNSDNKPSRWALVLSYVITIGLSWLIWRPLGAIITIIVLGNIRKIVIINSLAWTAPRYPAIFGNIIGVLVAIITQLSAYFAVKSIWALLGLTLLGFFSVFYIGYGVSKNRQLQNLADSYRLIAQGAAIISYLIASSIILGVSYFLR